MIPSSYPDASEIARLSARMLLEIKAVHFNAEDPFTLASGLPSPTYVDCRKLISYPRIRSTLMDFMTVTVMRNAGLEAFDNIAGGETAGIPFSALVAERMALPMTYVRKKPKGYGRNARIEGMMQEGQRVLLVEDDTATAKSIEMMLRSEGYVCDATDLGEDGLEIGKLYDYDIILLDLNLPDMSGYEVLKMLRVAKVKTPILILSGLGAIEDKVRGLGFGADDYMTKPFHKDELVARINAIVRRS